MKILPGFLIVLSMAANAAVESSAPTAINDAQAIALFYQRNLTLIAAQYDIDQARAEQIIASAIPNPVLSVTVGELSGRMFNGKQSDDLPAISPQIQQLIETAGKRRLRIEGGELGTEAAELDLQDTVRVLTNAVRHAFYALLLAQKSADLARDTVERYRQIVDANRRRLTVGDIAATDFTRIEVESLKAQGELDKAETASNQARADLLVLLGWPETGLQLTVADAWPAPATDAIGQNQQHLVEQAVERRPDLKAARVRIRQAEKNLALTRRLAIPDVTVSGYYARDPGNFFTNSGGIGFSVPLPVFYRQEGEIAKAGVAMNHAELYLRQATQSVRADVIKALSAWNSANAIARRFEEVVVDRLKQMRQAQEFAYQRGATGLLDLIDAERNYHAMMLDYYAALANRTNAWADLQMAVGEETRP